MSSIQRHTIYNICGSIAPLFVGMVTVPPYLHLIGEARYGVLAIVWVFLGYFGIFDPGITRAASYHIARLFDPQHDRERESVFWTALVVNLGFGLLGGIIVYLAARPLFMSTFKMPEAMRGEVMKSLPWLAASIPVSIGTGVLGGALQAREWFGVQNTINIVNGLASQLVPLGVAYWHGPDLNWLIPAVIIARMVGAVPTVVAVTRALPVGVGGRFDPALLKSLFTYGGWVTITNLSEPLLTAMDRMLIGGVIGAQAVAYYSVPFNLVTRASVLPGALSTSLFPKLSRGNQQESALLASQGLAALGAVTTPVIMLGIAAFPIFLRYWVGRSFAEHAASLGVILLVGVWVNGLACIPYGHLQAMERPDLVAKFHAIEIVPFLALLWTGMHFFGLVGAAYAWTLRVFVDAVLLFAVGGRTPGWQRLIPGLIMVVAAALLAPTLILSVRTLVEILLLLISVIWSWKLSPQIQSIVRSRVGFLRARTAV